MRSRMLPWTALLFAAALLFTAAPSAIALPYSQTRIIIEVNATAGDGGIQIFLDAEGWNRLDITDPEHNSIFSVVGSNSIGETGVTELFFESAEPSFDDLPLIDLLARFPAGSYRFAGETTDGKQLSGRATLSHNIPAGPTIASPEEGAALNPGAPIVIDWNPVTDPYPGTTLPIVISGYQVIVERAKAPIRQFSVFVPATVTSMTVPAEFIESGTDYKFEVLAIEQGGNQTITEGTFSTTGGGNLREDKGRADGADALGVRGAALRQNYPNPFNPATTLDFALAREGAATVRVIDIHGRLVRTLVSGRLPAGQHRATWDGNDASGRAVASGVYVVELEGSGVLETRKIVLSR